MEAKKRAKKLIKKMGHNLGPGHGDFTEMINKIQIEYLKNHILENVSKYRKLFLRYSSDSKVQDVQKELPTKKKKHSKKKVTADEAFQNGLTETVEETEKKNKLKEVGETEYCYNLYKRGKKNGLDLIPRRFYGHLLPILLHKDEDIWHQFVKLQGHSKIQKFNQLAQYTAGDQTLLESLMRIFLQLICDDSISAAEMSHFMKLFAMKKKFLSEELSGCQYGDLMAAIVAVYIDQVAIESRNAVKLHKSGKKLARLVSQLLAESPMKIIDSLLQCEKLTEKDAVLVTPLFRRVFQILKSQAKLAPPMYARALCLDQEAKRIFKKETNGNIFHADFRSLSIPQTFQDWLNKNGIKEYYIDTDQPAAFIASLMEALVEKEQPQKAQDNESSDGEVDMASNVQTEEVDQLFFIDTGADKVTKDMFPDMPQVEVEGGEGELDQGDDEDSDEDGRIASTSDEEGNEANESHCGTIVAETLKVIRELTERKQMESNYKETRAKSADFFDDSDVEVLEVRTYTNTQSKRQDSGKKRQRDLKSDIEKVGERTADKERSLNSCIELGQSDSDSDIGIEVQAEGMPKEGKSLLKKKVEKLTKSGPELKKTRSSKRGKGVLGARKSDDERGSVIMMNLVDMFAPEVTGEEDISRVVTQDLNIDSDVAVPDGKLLPLDANINELNPALGSRKSQGKKEAAKEKDLGKASKSNLKEASLKHVRGKDDDVTSPRKSQKKSKVAAEIDDCQIVSSPKKRRLEEQPKLDSPKKGVDRKVLSPEKNQDSENLQQKRVQELQSTSRMRTRSDGCDGVADSPVSPHMPRRRTRSDTVHTNQSSSIKSPLKEVDIGSDCEVSRNKLKFHLPMGSGIVIQEVDEQFQPIEDDEEEEQVNDELCLDSASKKGTQSKNKTTSGAKKTRSKPTSEKKMPGSPYKFHGSSSEEEDQDTHGTLKWSPMSPCCSSKSMTKIKPKENSKTPKGKVTPAETSSTPTRSPQKNKKSGTPAGTSVRSKKAVIAETRAIEDDVSVYPETPTSVPGSRAKTPAETKSSKKKKARQSTDSSKVDKGTHSGDNDKSDVRSLSTPKGKSVPPGTPKSVRGAVKELAESVPSTPKGKSVPPGTPKSVRGAVKELVESVPSTPKGKSVPPGTPKSVRGAVKELAVLKQCAMTDFFTASPLSPEESRRRYSFRHKPVEDDAQSSIFNKSATEVSDADIFGTPQAAVTYSGKKRRVSELPRASVVLKQLASPSAKRRLSSVKTNPATPSKLAYDLRH